MRCFVLAATLLSLVLIPATLRCAADSCPDTARADLAGAGGALARRPAPASDAPAPVRRGQQRADAQRETGNLGEPVLFSAREQGRLHHQPGQERLLCGRGQGRRRRSRTFTQEKKTATHHRHPAGYVGKSGTLLAARTGVGTTFCAMSYTPQGRAFLIWFDINVDLLSTTPTAASEIKRALDKATIQHRRCTGSSPATVTRAERCCTRGVLGGQRQACAWRPGAMILVLLTDGGDQLARRR